VLRRFGEIALAGGRAPAERPQVDERQLQALSGGNLELLADTLHNDLQAAAFALHLGLEQVVEATERLGALGAIVCGTGPTVAALVEDETTARSLAAALMRDELVETCLVARGSAPGVSVLEES
jgi:4-diphosphocytidyl-2-C-methyl-D-erythritol kinase